MNLTDIGKGLEPEPLTDVEKAELLGATYFWEDAMNSVLDEVMKDDSALEACFHDHYMKAVTIRNLMERFPMVRLELENEFSKWGILREGARERAVKYWRKSLGADK